MSWDFPEVRVRQAAFEAVTARAGLASIDSMREAFDVDIDEVRAAVRGSPVSPRFVASVLIAFPEQKFRDIFELELELSDRRE